MRNVLLIVCHGIIIRSLCGSYLEDRKMVLSGDKAKTIVICVYESNHGKHTFIKTYKYEMYIDYV